MATLAEITKKSKSLSNVISRTVASYAPRKTGPTGGNLQRALKRANNINTMFEVQGGASKEMIVRSLVFTYNYSPDDAPYGMWWNEPTLASNIKNGKTKNIPESINFAEKGLNDPQVMSAIDELVSLIGDSVLERISKELKEMESEY
jgi:hypothetical protein